MVEEIKEMLIALKNNWTIDFAKMEELCDYCLTTINQLQAYKDKEDKLREYIKEKEDLNKMFGYITLRKEHIKELLQILNEGENNE